MTKRTITPAAGQPQGTAYAGPPIDLGYSDDTQRERITKAETTYTEDLLGTAVEDPGSPASPTFYVRHPDTGEALGMRGPQGSFYFVSDLLGSVRAITDQDGELLRRYRYEPYGASAGMVDPPGAPQAPQNPIGFQGQYLDQETGLYKMGMRYMDPDVGRWTQRDGLNLAADPRQGNRYGFAGGDPVNLSDPSGMFVGDAWEWVQGAWNDYHACVHQWYADCITWDYWSLIDDALDPGDWYGWCPHPPRRDPLTRRWQVC